MIFKIAKCYSRGCTYRRYDTKARKDPGTCPKCGAQLRYLEKWYYRYSYRGTPKIKAVAPQKLFTEDALAKVKIEIREGRFFNKIVETKWNNAVEKFLKWAKLKKKEGTYEMYANSLKIMDRRFRAYTLNEIVPDMVDAHVEERLVPKKCPVCKKVYADSKAQCPKCKVDTVNSVTNATVNREIASIKRLCSWATEQKPPLLERNLIEKVELLPEPKARTRWLTEEEMERLLSECNLPYLKMGVTIALETGLREHGCFTLKWRGEIDDTGIHKEVKAGKLVHIPLTKTLKTALDEYKKSSVVISQYVIPDPKNPSAPCPFPKTAWQLALKRAKIEDFRFHDLRHTFATHFLLRGGKIENLQHILGHSDIQQTMKYAHIVDEYKRNDMEKFEEGRKK